MRRVMRMAFARTFFALVGLFLGSLTGCFTPVAARCPSCQELVLEKPPLVPETTRTVFLLVPGLLGYGSEWDGAQQALARYPDARVLIYSWEPWHSLAVSSARLAEHLGALRKNLPPSVSELFVIAHSAAGLLALDAAGQLSAAAPGDVPIRVLSVGAPLAGMGRNPWGGVDNRHTPLPIALGGHFSGWPAPAAGVSIEIYPTTGEDPVMQRSFGHDPGDPRVLPREAIVRKLPKRIGHNDALAWICEQLVEAHVTSTPVPAPAESQPPSSTDGEATSETASEAAPETAPETAPTRSE